MTSIQVCVLNHKSRDPQPVVDQIVAQGIEPTVMTDTTDFCQTRDDRRYTGLYNNFRACMGLALTGSADWVVILHDDVAVPPGLFDRIQYVLGFARPTMVSFYNPQNGAYREAQAQGRHVVQTYVNYWTQCFCFNRYAVKPILDWGDDHIVVGKAAEDGYLRRYCSYNERSVQVIVPSFVQHDGFDRSTFKIPSKVGQFERRSATYDPDFDVRSVDWAYEFSHPVRDTKKQLDKDVLKNI